MRETTQHQPEEEQTYTEADTRPTRPLAAAAASIPMCVDLHPGLAVAQATDVGLKRRRNEDSYWVMGSELCDRAGTKPIGLFVVADGMGGHEAGDAASSAATRVVASYVAREFVVPFLVDHSHSNSLPPIAEVLSRAIETAHVIVSRQIPNAGTTLTAALVLANRVYLAHVGDSRAYLFSQQGFHQLTQDHSLRSQLRAHAKENPDLDTENVNRNLLYKAVGQQGTLDVDTTLKDFPPSSCLLLCTDGLWDKVPDHEIRNILFISPTPKAAVRQLIAEANQRGGDDNVTAILVARGPES